MSQADLNRYLELSRKMAHELLHGAEGQEWQRLEDAATNAERAQAQAALEDEMMQEMDE